jgi:hypothetical protein
MGFDVYARNGAYYRANVWSWRPLLREIESTGALSDRDVAAIGYNDGHFIDAAGARALADALDRKYPDGFPELSIPPDPSFHVHGHSFCRDEMCKKVMEPCYAMAGRHFGEFVSFARASGGFEVW